MVLGSWRSSVVVICFWFNESSARHVYQKKKIETEDLLVGPDPLLCWWTNPTGAWRARETAARNRASKDRSHAGLLSDSVHDRLVENIMPVSIPWSQNCRLT